MQRWSCQQQCYGSDDVCANNSGYASSGYDNLNGNNSDGDSTDDGANSNASNNKETMAVAAEMTMIAVV